MVNLNPYQEEALAKFGSVAKHRKTIRAEADVAARREAERVREEMTRAYQDSLLDALHAAYKLGVPKKRLSEAYGSTDKRTLTDLLEQAQQRALVETGRL